MVMALEGIRVLDWTVFQQGPVASMLLGDLGADVIKVEERVVGDLGRGFMRVAGVTIAEDTKQRNPYFETGNRNKRSITLDLKKDEAREIIYRLVEKSDVFIHNFRSNAAEKLRMDYETLSRHNPRLIYAHASGWGPEGPDKDDPSVDYAALARSGFMMMVTKPGKDPQYPPVGMADQMGAIMTAYGILTALFVRERTGIGQRVDASIFGGMNYLVAYPLSFYTMAGMSGGWIDRKNASNPLYNHYKCNNDKWLAIALIPPDQYWPTFCQSMGFEELTNDARFRSVDVRTQNCQELIAILDTVFATKSSDEWATIFKQNGIIFSPMNNAEDLVNDPQALANRYIVEYDHPEWGKTKTTGFPVGFSETPCTITREAPEFGQHTEEILTEILGYGWDDITRLKNNEVI